MGMNLILLEKKKKKKVKGKSKDIKPRASGTILRAVKAFPISFRSNF